MIFVDFDIGRIFYEKNLYEKFFLVLIIKIMIMILICEVIEKGRIKFFDRVVVS